MSGLVTGEAVALDLRAAKLPSRVLAVSIDLLVAVAVYLVLTVAAVASTSSLDDAAEAAITVASSLLVLVGGPIAVETLSHGRSLGKLACGLRVVRDDGGPIRFRHALVRGGVGVVEILVSLGTIACAASLVSARGRRVGDVLAGTLVVRERVPAAQARAVPAPYPWLAARFCDLDLSGVPDDLWLAVRQYLTRMGQLDPQVGWATAARLAEDVAVRTGTPVPPGVPPAAYLAAVVHERQSRDASRAFGGRAVPGWSASGAAAAGDVQAQNTGGARCGQDAGNGYAVRAGAESTGTAQATGRKEPGAAPDGGAEAGRGAGPTDEGAASGGQAPATGFVPPA